jgi:hypothetical protein
MASMVKVSFPGGWWIVMDDFMLKMADVHDAESLTMKCTDALSIAAPSPLFRVALSTSNVLILS